MYHIFKDNDLKNKFGICKEGVILTVNRDSLLEAEDETLFDPADPKSGGVTIVCLYLHDLKTMLSQFNKKRVGRKVKAVVTNAYSEFIIADIGNGEYEVMVILRANAFRESQLDNSTTTLLLPIKALEGMMDKVSKKVERDVSIASFEKNIAPLLV